MTTNSSKAQDPIALTASVKGNNNKIKLSLYNIKT